MNGGVARKKSARKKNCAGRIGRTNGEFATLEPASDGSKEVALNLGSARGIADWCGPREPNPHSRIFGELKSCPFDDGHEWGEQFIS